MPIPEAPLPTRGILVAIEGIDGAGKTTQTQRLAALLRVDGHEVLTSKEPTDGPWGRLMRDSAVTGRLSHQQEIEAFLKDRRQHVRDLIQPALDRGVIVILDRYYFSMAAYQGLNPPPTANEILAMNEDFAPEPDLLVILDLPADIGLMRISGRGDRANLFERVSDLERSREEFLRFKALKHYTMLLDAQQDSKALAARIAADTQRRVADRLAQMDASIPEKFAAMQAALGRDPIAI